ncbi:MAG: DUF167 domain-containing protein [Proteobacteria bacterium]|nr:DUF167 domain-containing protein [Pseudomonadota bacterium]
MSQGALPWWLAPDGLLIRIRLTPKAQTDLVVGLEATADGPALKARVRAVPEDGAANAAAERLLADWLGVAKSNVKLASGGKSRVKTLHVSGDGTALARAAETCLRTAEDKRKQSL